MSKVSPTAVARCPICRRQEASGGLLRHTGHVIHRPTTITVRAVLCDMDGTLVDSTAVVEGVWAEFANRYGLDLNEILKTAHGRQTEPTVRAYGPPGIDVMAVSQELSAMELARLGGIVEVVGARAFVECLPPDRTALVTSSPRDLAALRMAAAGIAMPSVVVCADDVTKGKPDPECYLRAAEALGVDPADAVVFEDAGAGVAAAVAAGVPTIVVGDLDGDVAPDLPHISDFNSIRALTAADGSIELIFD